MEVHHHSHHGKKKWAEYFWEFFMLFLAVFCGFLAEYQLEHKIEKDREKQYIYSLVDDLKSDTIMLAANIKARKDRIQLIDSLLILIHSPSALRQQGNDLYYLVRRLSVPANIFPNDGTIQQLKSSGSLRLIHSKEIVNSIMSYDQKMRKALFEMGDESTMRFTFREQMVKVFDNHIFIDMTKEDNTVVRPVGNPTLFSYDAALINELSGNIQFLKRIHNFQLINSAQLLSRATELIDLLKREYHTK